MATVTEQAETITRAGLAATYNGSLSTSDTYKVPNDAKTVLHFKKTGAGACNVTIVTPGTVDGQAVSDRVVSVPATTGDRFIGPFPRQTYGDEITFTLSEITGLSFAAVRI